LRKASDAAPREASVRYHLAAALAKTGRNADAKRELDALLKAGTRFPELEEAKKLLNGL
jgi:Flp pilus assembly protein TadD